MEDNSRASNHYPMHGPKLGKPGWSGKTCSPGHDAHPGDIVSGASETTMPEIPKHVVSSSPTHPHLCAGESEAFSSFLFSTNKRNK